MRIGSATSDVAARIGDRTSSAAIVSVICNALPATSTSASRTNSVNAWTSEVSRETSTPARSRSKNPSGSACSRSKAAVRSAPRNRSPAVAASRIWARTTSGFATARKRNAIAALSSGAESCFLIPSSTAYRTSAGPASVISVATTTASAAPR
jgi:hypothetical protein